jgi:hypothetical protein
MSKYWKKPIEEEWYKNAISDETVNWAEEFGTHLAKKDSPIKDTKGNIIYVKE